MNSLVTSEATKKIRSDSGLWEFMDNYRLKTDECILWSRGHYVNGYGSVTYNGRKTRVHRLSLALTVGDNEKMYALHSCGNRNCYNPKHLRWGNQRENMQDKKLDGTERFGENHPVAKLKEEDVLHILSDTRTNREIADFYGVSIDNIRLIKKRRTWKHLN